MLQTPDPSRNRVIDHVLIIPVHTQCYRRLPGFRLAGSPDRKTPRRGHQTATDSLLRHFPRPGPDQLPPTEVLAGERVINLSNPVNFSA